MNKVNKIILTISLVINIVLIIAFIIIGYDYYMSKERFNKNNETLKKLGDEMSDILVEFNNYKDEHK